MIGKQFDSNSFFSSILTFTFYMVNATELIGYFLALLLSLIGITYSIVKICKRVKIRQSHSGDHLEIAIPYESVE